MATPYVPERGDVVWLEFNPQAGHEPAGHRPTLVLSPAAYNARTGHLLCCPVASRETGYPFEVPVGNAGDLRGVVLADQAKSLDWRARSAQPKGRVHPSVVAAVAAKLRTLLP